MKYTVTPSSLSGTIEIPPSKSHTHRALIFSLLAHGTSFIDNPLDSPDIDAMIQGIEQWGAQVKKLKNRLEIKGVGSALKPSEDPIDAKNSGIILRFIGALAALIPSYTVITGDRSIRTRRPIHPLLEGLKQLGAFSKSLQSNGYAPILIKGPLIGGKCTINGEDSQPVSALLIATSFAQKPSEIHVINPGEKPWIDLTLSWFDFLKLPYENHDYTHYKIPGGAFIAPFSYTVPGDFSSLAFPVAAALITQSEISIKNVAFDDIQGDKKTLAFFKQMGAHLEIVGTTLHVKKSGPLKGKMFDVNDTIDSITILAVLGCFAEGETILTNGAIARKKECDRIHSIATELKKMGADIEEKEDGLMIRPSKLKGTTLETYRDHRMALSLTVAALGAEGESIIQGAESVLKTYPNFKNHLRQLGANVQ